MPQFGGYSEATSADIDDEFVMLDVSASQTKFIRAQNMPSGRSLADQYVCANGALGQTIPPHTAGNSGSALATGALYLCPLALAASLSIGHLAFISSVASAVSAPTHWWFGLFDNNRAALAFTADQTSTAWAALTIKSLAVATIASGAASSFTTTYSGLYYLGIMMAASTCVGLCVGDLDISGQGNSGLTGNPGLQAGRTDTAQTTVPAFPFTAGSFGAVTWPGGRLPYAWVAA